MLNRNSASAPVVSLVGNSGKPVAGSSMKNENESGDEPASGGLSVVVKENDNVVPIALKGT